MSLFPPAFFGSSEFLSTFLVPRGKARESFCSLHARLGFRDLYKSSYGPIHPGSMQLFSLQGLPSSKRHCLGSRLNSSHCHPPMPLLLLLPFWLPSSQPGSISLLVSENIFFSSKLRLSLNGSLLCFPKVFTFVWKTKIQRRLFVFCSLSWFDESRAAWWLGWGVQKRVIMTISYYIRIIFYNNNSPIYLSILATY